MKTLNLLLSATLFACASTVANAHPLPKTSTPKPNAVLSTSPREIRIGFSEGLVGVFSGMEIRDKSGKAVSTGTAVLDPSDSSQLILPLTFKLVPGTYTVKWHAVGDDTHRVAGQYNFQLK